MFAMLRRALPRSMAARLESLTVAALPELRRHAQARYSAAKALAHPWICQDGVAPETPLDITIMSNMKRFSGYNSVKKAILVEIAKTFDRVRRRRHFISYLAVSPNASCRAS